MPILTMMLRVIEVGASAHVQQIALAMASEDPTGPGRKLLLALAQTPQLSAPVRAALENVNIGDVRAAVWAREDSDQQRLLEVARTETAPSPLAAIINNVQDLTALEAALRANPSKASLKAVVMAKRWDLPAQLLADAFGSTGRTMMDTATARALATSGHNFAAVASDRRIPEWLRLASCVSQGTPDDTVAAHLEDILKGKLRSGGHEGWTCLLALLGMLAERTPHEGVLRAYHAGREELLMNDDELHRLALAWDHWVNPARSATTKLADRLAELSAPDHVAALWQSLTDAEQEQMAPAFLRHELCPAEVFEKAREGSTVTFDRDIRWRQPLWLRQSETLFKEYSRANPAVMFGAISSAAECPWSPDPRTVAGWALDLLLELTPEPPTKGQEAASRWVQLLCDEHFPRHRLGQVPTFALAEVMNHTRNADAAWVTAAVIATLDQLEPADASVHASLLTSGLTPMDSFVDFCSAINNSLTNA